MNKPHCFGAMIWILKYDKDKIPTSSICDCFYKNKCLELTLNQKEKEEVKTNVEINLTKEELKILDIYLNTNPCQSGCALSNMQNSKKDCEECNLIKIKNNLLNKLNL